MAFLNKDDLALSIDLNEVDAITNNDETIVTNAIDAAVGEARGKLYNSFDVDTIFNKTGDSRNQMLLQVCVDIAVYRLVASNQAGQDIEDRETRYLAAKTWLTDCRDGKDYPDLERTENTIEIRVRTSGVGNRKPKRNNYA